MVISEEIKKCIVKVLDQITQNGITWKPRKDIKHLKDRKKRGHIPQDWELRDYEGLILSILNDIGNETYIYYKRGFDQNYFVFGDGYWIVIIGENGVMETAFPPDNYNRYLLGEDRGYTYVGTIEEVRNSES